MAPPKRGPPGNLQETDSLNLTVPATLFQYMTWLARNSMYGPTVQDVILKIITPQLHGLFESGFHNKRLPEAGPIQSLENDAAADEKS